MSTRCQIVITETDGSLYHVKVYKHSDGYPEGVMPTLEPFAKLFAENRGSDSEYFVAQLVRRFALEDAAAYAEKLKTTPEIARYYNPNTSFTGWGCSTYWHPDIEYLYIVSPDGSVRIIGGDLRIKGVPENQIPEGEVVQWPGTDPNAE